MDIKIIRGDHLKYVDAGAFGSYSTIKNTKLGIKEINCRNYYGDTYTSVTQIKQSEEFKSVKKEFKRLKKLNSMTRCVPKAHYVAIIEKYDSSVGRIVYSCGYVMTHIKGKTATNSNLSSKDWNKLQAARRRLKKKGIYQIDSHGGNVMVKKVGRKKRFVFIDAGGLRFGENENCDWS